MTRPPATVFDRSVALERLGGEEFDVLIVRWRHHRRRVALEASAGGLRTALVERSDFAAGTSSKSSKLVHGASATSSSASSGSCTRASSNDSAC